MCIRDSPNTELFIARPSVAPSSLLRETIVTVWKMNETQESRDENFFALLQEKNVFRDKFFFDWSRRSNLGKEIRWYLQKRLVARINEIEYVSRNNSMRPPTAPLKFLNHVSEKNTDIIQEYFIPINNFIEFIDGVRTIVVEDQINLMGMTIRYIPKNNDVFLSYGKKEAFSDGVSSRENSWHIVLKNFIDSQISDKEFEKESKSIDHCKACIAPIDPPTTLNN